MAEKYRMLGESGLWEDEEGNIVDPSEIEGYEPADPALKKKISERLKNFGVQDELNDKTNLAGYMDVRGKMISPCIWEDAWDFHEGLAKVQKDGRQGMINQLGELVIPCKWKALGFCSESMIPVKNDEGKCGYMNCWTKEIVIDFQWKEACMFREGLAGVQSFENNRLGYINKKGEVVIPFVWKKIRDFHNGLALVSPGKKFLWWDKWIYINKKGEYVKDFKWF